ncbi:MAG: oligopeptide:H+ symporter, partial [Pseudomonadota bacterium]
ALFGIYAALAFSAPVMGGIIADSWIGYPRAVLLGLIIAIIGNLLLLHADINFLFLGLAFVITGIGFFKASNASLLGELYQTYDVRKEEGFTLFYMGMNIGAIFGPLIFGFGVRWYGFRLGFIFNIIGLSICLILFAINYGYFKNNQQSNHNFASQLKALWQRSLSESLLIVSIFILIIGFYLLFSYPVIFKELFWMVLGLTFIVVLFLAYYQQQPYRNHIILLLLLNVFIVFYFASSLQIGSSLLVYINTYLDTSWWGITLPPEAFVSLQSIFIIVSAPILAPVWQYFENKHHAPLLFRRVFLGLLFAGISFLIFALVTRLPVTTHFNLPLWCVFIGNFFLALGELCIVPPILSAITYLLPGYLRATFIGIFYLFCAFSAYLASVLATLTVPASKAAEHVVGKMLYYVAFRDIAIMTLLVSLLFWLIKPLLVRLYHRPLAMQQTD